MPRGEHGVPPNPWDGGQFCLSRGAPGAAARGTSIAASLEGIGGLVVTLDGIAEPAKTGIVGLLPGVSVNDASEIAEIDRARPLSAIEADGICGSARLSLVLTSGSMSGQTTRVEHSAVPSMRRVILVSEGLSTGIGKSLPLSEISLCVTVLELDFDEDLSRVLGSGIPPFELSFGTDFEVMEVIKPGSCKGPSSLESVLLPQLNLLEDIDGPAVMLNSIGEPARIGPAATFDGRGEPAKIDLAGSSPNVPVNDASTSDDASARDARSLRWNCEKESCLSQEEVEDIVHRDRCQGSQGKNGSDTADLNHDIGMTGDELERMGDKETELKVAVKSLEEEIDTSRTSLAELLSMRPTVVEKGGVRNGSVREGPRSKGSGPIVEFCEARASVTSTSGTGKR